MLEQKMVKSIDMQKNIWEYTIEELHSILGNFRKEYREATTGKIIHNNILGYVREGNVEHALQINAITKRDGHYFIKLPEYRDYDLKFRVLGEIMKRREHAREKERKEFKEIHCNE